MPVALERALKRRASKLGLGKERKDAYVYGTLRKTGWKPSREKKMSIPNTKLIRLSRIDENLDSIIKFDDQDDQNKFPWLKTGAAVGAGAGGVLAHQAIRKTGGYGANLLAMRSGGQDLLGQATGNVAQGAGRVGAALAPAYSAGKTAVKAGVSAGKSAWQSILAKLGGTAAKALESKEKPIEFGFLKGRTPSELLKLKPVDFDPPGIKGLLKRTLFGRTRGELSRRPFPGSQGYSLSSKTKSIEFDASILGPWHGSKGHESKIDQLEFPAGLSPAAALKFPLPKLMRFMNQRNLQQQVFSRKMERLIELNSVLDEVQLQTPLEEFNRKHKEIHEQAWDKMEAVHRKRQKDRDKIHDEYYDQLGKAAEKLHKESYVGRGYAVGSSAGAALGAGAGLGLAKLVRGGKILPTISGGAYGALAGLGIGGGIGASIRRKKVKEMSAKLDEILFEEKEYKPRVGQRLILGNPLTTAVHGRPGFRYGGYKQAAARRTWETFKGASIGELSGMGIGAGIGALGGGAAGAEKGALVGGAIGGLGGTIAGNVKGTFGKKAKDVYRRYTNQ